jgi:hypothetical protein
VCQECRECLSRAYPGAYLETTIHPGKSEREARVSSKKRSTAVGRRGRERLRRSEPIFVRVHVYVDGFNLYRGGLELAGAQPGWKWLDIRALGLTLASDGWAGNHTINKVVYCTAWVKPTKMDPGLPLRQKTFIRAPRGRVRRHLRVWELR